MVTDREARLLLDAAAAGIDSSGELANFMAQVTHESNGLTALSEGFRYTKGITQISSKVRSALREGPDALEVARREALEGRPEKLAELMYGDRMGNDLPGDALKYRGRGYIQLTGKAQYKETGEALGIDLLQRPELASEPEFAGKIATWYWKKNVRAQAAEDVALATQIINGGENGLTDRRERFKKWSAALTPDVMENLAKGNLVIPIASTRNAQDERATQDPTTWELQKSLGALGYTDEQGRSLVADGHYGKRTHEAVTAFQRDHGLNDDGVAGANTWSALQKATRAASLAPTAAATEAPAVTTEPPAATFPQMAPSPDLDTATIRALQQHLNTLGITDDRNQALPITGTYDDATHIAVMAFQREQGLADTGLADPATRALIEARATIVELQQSANMHSALMREAPLQEGPAHTPGSSSVAEPNLPSISAEITQPSPRAAYPTHPTYSMGNLPPASQTPPEPVAPPVPQDAASNQDTLAILQLQMHEMQRQMEAMHRQREQERERESEREHSRTTPNEPTSHATPPLHDARNEPTSARHNAERVGYSDPRHPVHPLYADLRERLETQGHHLPEDRLTQITGNMHTLGFQPNWEGHAVVKNDTVYVADFSPWGFKTHVNLKEPAPSVQETLQQVDAHQQMLQQERSLWEQQAQSHGHGHVRSL